MNHLYLIRHGENTANLTKEFSHRAVDYSLTEKGILQAQQTAEYLKDMGVDAVFASPLKRAAETAAIIAGTLGLSYTILEELREVNVGELEGQPPTQELWDRHNEVIAAWFTGDVSRAFPGGEDALELRRRFKSALDQIFEGREGQRIIVVGHGGQFTFALPELCPQVDMTWVRSRSTANCAISQVRVERRNGSWQGELLAWAEFGHLSGYAAELVTGYLPSRK